MNLIALSICVALGLVLWTGLSFRVLRTQIMSFVPDMGQAAAMRHWQQSLGACVSISIIAFVAAVLDVVFHQQVADTHYSMVGVMAAVFAITNLFFAWLNHGEGRMLLAASVAAVESAA